MEVLRVISGVIGLGSVLLCLVQKVPQLVSLVKAGNAAGISLPSLALEFWGYASTVTYSIRFSHPFSSYCEYPALVVQDFFLLAFVLRYCHLLGPTTLSIFALFLGIQYSMASGMLPVWAMMFIINVGIPISTTSKVLQLTKILREKDSGNISAASWSIGAITSAARFFTFTVEVWDPTLALNMVISTILNSAVLAATIHYQKSTSKKT